MTQYVFGTGQLFAMPVGGGAPLRFGALQDVSVDISGDIKELHGQYQFALDTARGKSKIEWKAASGNIDVAGYNQLFFNQQVATGEPKQVFNEAASIPGASTYTVTAANGATFLMDLGVYYAADAKPLKQVPSAPNTGEYSVSAAGVYTFAAGDASKNVLLNYLYTSASTGGTLTVTNQLMGQAPRFQLVATQKYNGQSYTCILYSAIAEKLSLPLKQDDYMISDFSGSAFADAAGRVLAISTSSISGGGA